MKKRSDCPIAQLLDVVGDKWSLLIVRDMLFFGKKTFSDLQNSEERIATNILSNRLALLEEANLLTKEVDRDDKRKKFYQLTESGKSMLPILLEIIVWSSQYKPDANIPNELVDRYKTDRNLLMAELMN